MAPVSQLASSVRASSCCHQLGAVGGLSRLCIGLRGPPTTLLALGSCKCAPAHNRTFLGSVSGTTALRSSRREAAWAVIGLLGTKDPTTLLNAVLSGYGLPTLGQGNDLDMYDEFEDNFTFSFPKRWVSRPNSMREGVYISDYNTADKVTVDLLPLPGDGDLVTAATAKIVNPSSGQQDDRLELPNRRLVKVTEEQVDGRDYVYMEFPSSTITRSGYSVKRKNFAAVSTLQAQGVAVVLNTSARSDQFNSDKENLLRAIQRSFRIR